jgi:hypothetical protein
MVRDEHTRPYLGQNGGRLPYGAVDRRSLSATCMKLFEARNVNLGLRIVHKVRQTLMTPEGPETYLEVLNSTGKIRFPILTS